MMIEIEFIRFYFFFIFPASPISQNIQLKFHKRKNVSFDSKK